MQLGLVIGRVTATRKDECLVGTKLLITKPTTPDGKEAGTAIVTVDTVGAGVGEQVIFVTGSVASRVVADGHGPIDAAIVGIIDQVDIQ